MPIKALNPMAPFWFVPESEAGEENPTRFQIRGLDGNQIAHVVPGVHIGGDDFSIDHNAMRQLLGFGLLGWENFENDEGPVRFYKNPDKNMTALPYGIQCEIAGAIFDASNISEDERKN